MGFLQAFLRLFLASSLLYTCCLDQNHSLLGCQLDCGSMCIFFSFFQNFLMVFPQIFYGFVHEELFLNSSVSTPVTYSPIYYDVP